MPRRHMVCIDRHHNKRRAQAAGSRGGPTGRRRFPESERYFVRKVSQDCREVLGIQTDPQHDHGLQMILVSRTIVDPNGTSSTDQARPFSRTTSASLRLLDEPVFSRWVRMAAHFDATSKPAWSPRELTAAPTGLSSAKRCNTAKPENSNDVTQVSDEYRWTLVTPDWESGPCISGSTPLDSPR